MGKSESGGTGDTSSGISMGADTAGGGGANYSTSDAVRGGSGVQGSTVPYQAGAVETPSSSSGRSFDEEAFAEMLKNNQSGYNPSNIPSVEITPTVAPGSGGVANFQKLPPFALAADLRGGRSFKNAASNTDLVTQFLAALQGKGGAQ
jgi:hypothetical protein